jgi:signal transduction histidine kinase
MEMNAYDALTEACEIIEPLIESQGYTLETNFNNLDKNATFMGDRKRIRSVILNLAKNSVEALNEDPKIKTGENKGKISLRAESDPQHIRTIFGNNGPEIPCEHEKKVYRGNFTTKTSGTGAGLMTCAHIIEKVFGGMFFWVNKSASVHPEEYDSEGLEFYAQLLRNPTGNRTLAYQTQ